MHSKLLNKDFDFVRKKLKLYTSGINNIDSNYTVPKEAWSIVKPYKVKNAKYGNDLSNTI